MYIYFVDKRIATFLTGIGIKISDRRLGCYQTKKQVDVRLIQLIGMLFDDKFCKTPTLLHDSQLVILSNTLEELNQKSPKF